MLRLIRDRHLTALTCSLAAGAASMFFFDPRLGRSRRARGDVVSETYVPAVRRLVTIPANSNSR